MLASFFGLKWWTGKELRNKKALVINNLGLVFGGERGIRTPGPDEGSTVFKTAAFDRSASSPDN